MEPTVEDVECVAKALGEALEVCGFHEHDHETDGVDRSLANVALRAVADAGLIVPGDKYRRLCVQTRALIDATLKDDLQCVGCAIDGARAVMDRQ